MIKIFYNCEETAAESIHDDEYPKAITLEEGLAELEECKRCNLSTWKLWKITIEEVTTPSE